MKHKTVFQIEVEHDRPLPAHKDLVDVLAERAYGWSAAEGVRVNVTAKRLRVESVDHGSAPHESEGSVCDA